MNWCDFFNAIPFSLGPERTKDAKTRFSPIQVSESVLKKCYILEYKYAFFLVLMCSY